MRIKNSFYNMAAVVVLYFVKIILSFAGKTCLIQIMGDEYNGIYALFGSIISMLSIAELGIGSAIIYNLYKPVKEKHIEEIKMIMNFYKQCYSYIANWNTYYSTYKKYNRRFKYSWQHLYFILFILIRISFIVCFFI